MITVQESHRVSWSHLIFLCDLWHWKPCGTTCCCSLDISSLFKIYLLTMKLDMTYLKLLFLKPQEMKTNFILMTEKALKIRTDSRNKSNDGVLTTSTGMIRAGVFSTHFSGFVSQYFTFSTNMSWCPACVFRMKHFASREKILHAELEAFAKSSYAHSFCPSAYCVLLCPCLFRCRGYEPERILTSAKGRNNKHYISEFLAESLLFLPCLSLRGCSHRAFLETKVAPLPLRQHQVYELASGRQRIVGGDLDTHSSPASWGGIISTGFIWVILQSCRMHVQTCDIELEEIAKYNRKLQHLPNNPNKTTRASYQEQTPAAIKCVKEIFTCGKRDSLTHQRSGEWRFPHLLLSASHTRAEAVIRWRGGFDCLRNSCKREAFSCACTWWIMIDGVVGDVLVLVTC